MAKRWMWATAAAMVVATAFLMASGADNPLCTIFTDPWDPMCWLLGCCL